MNIVSKTPKIELLLQPHELLHLDNKKHPIEISCKNGLVWVTCEGERRDQFLRAGRSFYTTTPGNIVIEAIAEACIDIEENLN